MKQGKSKNRAIYGLLLGVLGILLDQWTKYLAVRNLKNAADIILIPGVLQLSYVENRGAAFGLLQNQRVLFFIFTAVVMVIGLWFYRKIYDSPGFFPLRACIILILTGACGNLIDRLRLVYVVDFIYFSLIDFPVFNVADIFVTVGTFLLLILFLFYYKEEDLAAIFDRKQ